MVVLSAILNRYRIHKFSKVDQFVMGYSGLRGAVAYGLVESLPEIYPAKNTYITAAIGIILFTVFVQVKTAFEFISLGASRVH